jgi:uncharacterized protein YsxB (DUF464 family)
MQNLLPQKSKIDPLAQISKKKIEIGVKEMLLDIIDLAISYGESIKITQNLQM